jgi:hypothetical protein
MIQCVHVVCKVVISHLTRFPSLLSNFKHPCKYKLKRGPKYVPRFRIVQICIKSRDACRVCRLPSYLAKTSFGLTGDMIDSVFFFSLNLRQNDIQPTST